MNNITKIQLFALFERHEKLWKTSYRSLPWQDYDSDWLSPCQSGAVDNDKVFWKATERQIPIDLKNIEDALEVKLHQTIVDFFCSAYSGDISCMYQGHPIDLIQVWNDDDFKQLQENMIAHFLMQKRLKQPASMFIASCSDEMQIISILNETGQVQLENLGKGQEAILAENLVDFLTELDPVVKQIC